MDSLRHTNRTAGEGITALNSVAVFKGLDDAALRELEQGSIPLELRDGTAVFTQGDPADSAYAILRGNGDVRIGVVDRNSKALMVEVFGPGEIFGEIGVIDGGPRTASAFVEGELQLLRIPAAIFLATLRRCPTLSEVLHRMMARRLRRTFELFQDATFETLEIRLARQVLYLAEREGPPTPQGLRLAHRFRQPDLADLLGATTRSIITILNAWRAREIVHYDADQARLTVKDLPALKKMVEMGRNHRPRLGPVRPWCLFLY